MTFHSVRKRLRDVILKRKEGVDPNATTVSVMRKDLGELLDSHQRLDEKLRDYHNREHPDMVPPERIRLVWGKCYVVEVAMNQQNPIHRALLFDFHEGHDAAHFKLFNTSYEPEVLQKSDKDLAFFRVIEEVTAYNSTKYLNYCTLPKDANTRNTVILRNAEKAEKDSTWKRLNNS